jgi:hypothetical protein
LVDRGEALGSSGRLPVLQVAPSGPPVVSLLRAGG